VKKRSLDDKIVMRPKDSPIQKPEKQTMKSPAIYF
jgi:hypothetical protein